MTDQDLTDMTLAAAAAQIKNKEVSPIELTELMLARIDRLNPKLVAFVTVAREEALADARAAEAEIRDGRHRGAASRSSPVHQGQHCDARHPHHRGVQGAGGLRSRLRRHGGDAVERGGRGDPGQDQHARVGQRRHHHQPVLRHHPQPLGHGADRRGVQRRIGGGSGRKSGSGSLGTDNGGSVRNPASLCGIVGFKPTYGRVSRFGHVPGDGGFSTNHVGVFSKTVRDCALILGAISGRDPKDPNSADEPVPDYENGLVGGVEGLRVGIVKDYFDRYMTRAVSDVFAEAQRQLESVGARLVEVEVPHLDATRVAWPCITRPENVVENLPYLTARPRDYSPRLLHQNIGAMLIPADAYVTAQRIRRLLCREFDEVFEQVDIIAAPTAAVPAPTIEESERAVMEVDGEEIRLESPGVNYRSLFTTPFNLTGLPALSVNCGFTDGGLPIGLQIVGPRFREERVLRAAHAYEQAAGWYRRKPPAGA